MPSGLRSLEGLSDKDRRFMEKARAVDHGNYGLDTALAIMIAQINGGNAFEASCDFYRAGFLKGLRAAKKGYRE